MKKFRLLILLLVLALAVHTAGALPLIGDPGALFSGSTSQTFSGGPGGARIVNLEVEYAIYLNNGSGYGGLFPSAGQYLYAYKIYNKPTSNTSINSFSVGVPDTASVEYIGSDYYQSIDGIEPAFEYSSGTPGQAATFVFLPAPMNGLLDVDKYSYILLFTSDDAWASDGFGSIQAGSVIGEIPNLPAPVPEPATVLLFGVGGALFSVLRKRFI